MTLLLLVLPLAVFFSGAWVMSAVSGRDYVIEQLRQNAAPEDRKPLNERIRGYDAADLDRHWGSLDGRARRFEQRFLELDLLFPCLYGAALATSLLLAWAALGRPFHPAWLVVPVGITVVAHWTENLVQLSELHAYAESGRVGLDAVPIQIASTATVIKLVFFSGAALMLLGLAVLMLARALHAPS